MSSPSWEEIERAVAAVLQLPEQQRGAWLSKQPAAIREEVESLLSAYGRSGDFLGDETATQTAGPDLTGRMEAVLARVKGATVAADFASSPGEKPIVNAGTQLGPYRIEHLLGKGGMAEVFRGTDTPFGPNTRSSAGQTNTGHRVSAYELKRREAALAHCAHANLLATIDVGLGVMCW